MRSVRYMHTSAVFILHAKRVWLNKLPSEWVKQCSPYVYVHTYGHYTNQYHWSPRMYKYKINLSRGLLCINRSKPCSSDLYILTIYVHIYIVILSLQLSNWEWTFSSFQMFNPISFGYFYLFIYFFFLLVIGDYFVGLYLW